MVRFVLSPDGVVTPDLRRRLPGRGVWVDATHKSVAQAVQRRAFARGFKAEAKASETLADEVGRLMRQAALQRLALAQKAGLVVAGFEKVRAVLTSGTVRGIVFASDGADDGRNKLEALAKKAQHLHNDTILADVLSSAELERTLGRNRVVHVALLPGRVSDLFFTDALRLRGYEFEPLLGADSREQPDEHVFAGPLTL